MSETLNNTGAGLTFLFGLLAFVKPRAYAKIILFEPMKKGAITEIRSTYGGLIMGLSAYVLWSQSVTAFHTLAFGWFALAIARSAGTLLDKSFSKMTLVFLAIEIVTGILCFV